MESAQSRFDRTWTMQVGDRKPRGWDQRSHERRVREFWPHEGEDESIEPVPQPEDTFLSEYTDEF